MPADLLRRRPDVRTAEMQLAAQSALIGVSEAALYPSIALVGTVGISATSQDASATTLNWAAGPALAWNVFDYGRLKNQVLVQDARFQQLYEVYQDTVLRAARELDDAAVSFAKGRTQVDLLEQAVQAAKRSLDIATIQYQEGLVDFERVLDSQRTLFSPAGSPRDHPRWRDAEPRLALQGDGRRMAGRPQSRRARRGHARNHVGAQQLEGPVDGTAAAGGRSIPATEALGPAMSQEPEAQTSSANAKADVPRSRSRGRPRHPDRSRRHRCTDHREPGALLRRRPAHAVHLAGTRTGLRRSGGGRGLGQGDGGPHPQRRRRRAGAAAVRHRSGAIRDRAAARPVRLRVGAAVGQRVDRRRGCRRAHHCRPPRRTS